MFFYIVLSPISTTSGLWSTGNTRKNQQIDVYIYQCDFGGKGGPSFVSLQHYFFIFTDKDRSSYWHRLLISYNLLMNKLIHARIQRRTVGPDIPPTDHKAIGFPCNTGPDPLKNPKATKPAYKGPSSTRQQNAI